MQHASAAATPLDGAWRAMGGQLRNPQGLGGWLAGILMRVVNDGPNRRAVQALDIRPGDHLLELGCGPGHGVALMAARASRGRVYGLDHSPVMLKQAFQRNRRPIAAGRVRLGTGSFERLEFEAGSLDAVLAVNVAYFWGDPGRVTREIHRVLRPGGKVAIYVTDASTMRRWCFAGRETHQLIDAVGVERLLLDGGFGPTQISVRPTIFAGHVAGLIGLARRD